MKQVDWRWEILLAPQFVSRWQTFIAFLTKINIDKSPYANLRKYNKSSCGMFLDPVV